MRRPRRRAHEGNNAGFTLLETLVAVLVLAALVSVVPRTLVAARTIIERSADWLEARLVAETVLNEALGGELKSGAMSGVVDGRRWTARLRPAGMPQSESGRVLLDVRVEVAVSGDRVLEVDTMRIGRPR
jgi:prepilin-type N-terminal cleavage/methylation domain-containing protein